MTTGDEGWRQVVVGTACALALLLVDVWEVHAQDGAAPPGAAEASSFPAEPPFPPPPIAGEAPVPVDDSAPVAASTAPAATEETGAPAAADGDALQAPRRPPAASPAPAAPVPGPRFVQPPPLPPSAAPPQPAPRPVRDDVQHARGIGLMLLQFPTGALWGAAVAGTGLVAASALLAAPNMVLFPLGGLLAAAPLLVSLAGGGVAVLVNLGTAAVVDLLSGHPAPDGTAGKLALWSGLYAGLVAVVTGLPLAIPVALAASGVFSDDQVGNVLAYALVASVIPLAVAPMAMLEAANEAGYSADLPAWCWHAMSICSFGTYVFF
jgi:hypothetical protein